MQFKIQIPQTVFPMSWAVLLPVCREWAKILFANTLSILKYLNYVTFF